MCTKKAAVVESVSVPVVLWWLGLGLGKGRGDGALSGLVSRSCLRFCGGGEEAFVVRRGQSGHLN